MKGWRTIRIESRGGGLWGARGCGLDRRARQRKSRLCARRDRHRQHGASHCDHHAGGAERLNCSNNAAGGLGRAEVLPSASSRAGGLLPMSFRRGSLVLMYSAGMFAARITLLATLLFAAAGLPSAASAQCVSGQEARQLLEQGQVVPFPEALRRAGVSRDQLAGNPQLCQAGGGFVYRVRVYQDGQLTGVNIPAN